MGFLDRAKKLAEQAMGKAEEALSEVKARTATPAGQPAPPVPPDPRFGTPYVPGMLGRPGWRERGLPDPAAVLPVDARERAGVPHSTRSEIVAEPFGVGRRWASGGRSAGLFYQLDPEHLTWEPADGRAPFAGVGGATAATLGDGRSLVFLSATDRHVVVELSGFDADASADLAGIAAERLEAT